MCLSGWDIVTVSAGSNLGSRAPGLREAAGRAGQGRASGLSLAGRFWTAVVRTGVWRVGRSDSLVEVSGERHVPQSWAA